MGRSMPVLLAISALLLLFIWCASSHAPAIEARLAARATHALATDSPSKAGREADELRLTVAMEGRVATLTGTLDSEGERTEILRRVAAVAGVRRVRDALQVSTSPTSAEAPEATAASTSAHDTAARDTGVTPSARPQTPFPNALPAGAAGISLSLADNGLTLRGAVPDETVRREVTARAIAMVGDSRVRDELVVASPAPEPVNASEEPTAAQSRVETFGRTVVSLLDALESGPTDARLVWREDAVTATGSVPNRAAADRFLQTLRSKTPALELVDQLTITPPAPAEQVQARVEAVLRDGRIQFRTGGARLSEEGERVLSAVARELRASPTLRIAIEGHTDASGDAASNLSLSRHRAQAVRAFLVDRSIAETRMSAEGFGETRPIADNTSVEGRQANRRIEFRVSEEGED